MNRPVTEQDFRQPHLRDAKPEDYEFRPDGKLVRKDRWCTGFRKIAELLGFNPREQFEIDEVVAIVEGFTNGTYRYLQNRDGKAPIDRFSRHDTPATSIAFPVLPEDQA